MRKTFLLPLILWATLLFLFSCQKEEIKNISNEQLISKVKSWLEKEKKGLLPFKAANIDLLKDNLEFSNLRVERSKGGDQIIIIPISEKFKFQKINKNSIPNLVLLSSNSGEIKKGNVVLFEPKTKGLYNKVPDNTFFDIFNTSRVKCDGRFQFSSIAGHWDYQLEYSNGNLTSCGVIEARENSNGTTRTNTICINWYLVTSYYVDGVLVAQTTEYVGTTCSDQCGDGSYQSLCPDGGGSGGGGSNDSQNSENCSNSLTGSTSSEMVSILTSNDDGVTRTKTYNWTIYKGVGSIWKFNSHETGVHKKTNNEWRWESLTHNNVSREGFVVAGDVQCLSDVGTPTLGLYNASMTLRYNIQISITCQGITIATNKDYTSTIFINVND